MLYLNRKHAGMLLAEKLEARDFDRANTIVIAIPRGGVPLGHEIAKRHHLPLDIILVKKIGAPHYPELAIGSVSEDNELFYNYRLLAELRLNTEIINPIKEKALQSLQQSSAILRAGRVPLSLSGKEIILVDDGIATGATMEVVIQVLKKRNVKSITVAAPVASAETAQWLSHLVDHVVVLNTPNPIYSVGEWYGDFTQVNTLEAVELLAKASETFEREENAKYSEF